MTLTEDDVIIFCSGNGEHLSSKWKSHYKETVLVPASPFSTIDIVLDVSYDLNQRGEFPREDEHDEACLVWLREGHEVDHVIIHTPNTPPAISFLLDVFRTSLLSEKTQMTAIKLVQTEMEGYILQEDFLEIRMVDCELAEKTVGFSKPHQRIQLQKPVIDGKPSLLKILEASIGGIVVVGPTAGSLEENLANLETELANRISFPWLSMSPVDQKRLALVDDSSDENYRHDFLKAVHRLGVSLIVLGRQGHWLQGPRFASSREAFLPIDMAVDSGLPSRIMEALQEYGVAIDGITALADRFLASTARVAELMKLPTSPAASFEKCVDKLETRRVVPGGCQVLCVSDLQELRDALLSTELFYPLIVKPAQGSGSKGVSRVVGETELLQAVETLLAGRRQRIIIETFVDGPEVDANFVIHDGRLLFCEISDEFPCDAEGGNATGFASFMETDIVFPSTLSKRETELIQSSLFELLLKLGFLSGVFHVEARIQNSTMEYKADDDGVIDLRRKQDSPQKEPSVFVIEVNARPPGFICSSSSAHTYGIDYYCLQVLTALDDKERLLALSKPFRDGAQAWYQIVFIATDRGGIFKSENTCEELMERFPDLIPSVAESRCFFKNGQRVPDPRDGITRWVASFILRSKVSRLHVIRQAKLVREEIRYQID